MRNNTRTQHANSKCCATLIAAAALFLSPGVQAQSKAFLTLDEDAWVAFYDVPSRRFRSVRDQIVAGNVETAERDLDASISFLSVEANRAPPELEKPFAEVMNTLSTMRDDLRAKNRPASDFDATFARAHWILTQQYFVFAIRARDSEQHRNAGHYLWATAHHLERAILWSNTQIDRRTVAALDSMREMAGRLRDDQNPARVYRDRPLRTASRAIIRVGERLDRRVRVRDAVNSERG